MNYEFTSDMEWPKGVNTSHTINIDLDITVSNVLRSARNIKVRLITREQEVRKEIFTLVVGEIIPKIINETGLDATHPEGKMSVNAKSKIESRAQVGIPTREDTFLFVRDQEKIVLEITADRPVNAMQAMYANRGGLATDITNHLVKILKRAVLKTRDEKTETDFLLSGNEVVSFDFKLKKSSSDGN